MVSFCIVLVGTYCNMLVVKNKTMASFCMATYSYSLTYPILHLFCSKGEEKDFPSHYY